MTRTKAAPLAIGARRAVLSLCLLALAACAAERAPSSTTSTAAPQRAAGTIYIGTAGVTGVYYPAGGAVCRLVNEDRARHGLHCSVESTEGSAANIAGIETGDLDFGVVQSDLQYEAYRGVGRFAPAGAFEELRSVFSLHAEPFTVVALSNAGIARFGELPGKRVNIGNPGSGQRATMEALMQAEGWTSDSFALVTELDSTAQSQALAAQTVDAIVFTVGHPSGAILEATKVADVRLIPVTGPAVDRLIADAPYYAKAVIPGGFYRGTSNDTPTFGVRATLVTSTATSDEVVYQLVKSVFEGFDRFEALHPALGQLDKREMIEAALTAPLHPGAERYYREAGLL
ncbi:MAG TPA: TAXI family TRAP transporter solute-binding subunit [Geminicoccaceae bacterium]|nr:TAXI family TRAP transporter solute-binding subunit [Geminicoccaceae bacterium]